MSNPNLIDPELLPLMRALPSGGNRSRETMPAVRAAFNQWIEQRARSLPPPPTNVTRSEVQIPGDHGKPSLRALLYRPSSASGSLPAILDIHGGSFILGSPEMNDFRNRNLASDLGLVIVSIDYRLAPENPYPAALDDAYTALAWMHREAQSLRIDPARIGVSGDSAGGAIAAGLALRTRDEKSYALRNLILIYPAVADVRPQNVPAACLEADAAANFARYAYLGTKPDAPPYAVPANAETLSGLPPVFLSIGALDFLVDANFDFARRLVTDGVPTEFHVYPGAFHGFDMAHEANVTKRFYSDLRSAIERDLIKTREPSR